MTDTDDTVPRRTRRRSMSPPPKLEGGWFAKLVIGSLPAVCAGLIAWGALQAQMGYAEQSIADVGKEVAEVSGHQATLRASLASTQATSEGNRTLIQSQYRDLRDRLARIARALEALQSRRRR